HANSLLPIEPTGFFQPLKKNSRANPKRMASPDAKPLKIFEVTHFCTLATLREVLIPDFSYVLLLRMLGVIVRIKKIQCVRTFRRPLRHFVSHRFNMTEIYDECIAVFLGHVGKSRPWHGRRLEEPSVVRNTASQHPLHFFIRTPGKARFGIR